jgi:hypothetical protein
MTATQRISFFDQISRITNKDSNEIFSFFESKAREVQIGEKMIMMTTSQQ